MHHHNYSLSSDASTISSSKSSSINHKGHLMSSPESNSRTKSLTTTSSRHDDTDRCDSPISMPNTGKPYWRRFTSAH